MTKRLHIFVILIAAVFLPNAAMAQANKIADDYETYKRTGALATEMFAAFLKMNIAAIRTSAILTYCSKDGLAKAVEATEVDRQLGGQLNQLISEGKFSGLPSYSILEAQSAANSFIVGYNFGLLEALKLTPEATKNSLCAASVDAANKLLSK